MCVTAGMTVRFFRADPEHLLHEGNVGVRLEILPHRLAQNGRGEGPERLPSLDLGVQDVLHVRAARIDDDRTIPEGAGPPLHPPLEPAGDETLFDLSRKFHAKFLLRQFPDAEP